MEDSALTFARPLWLYAAPLVVVLLAWLFVGWDRRREADLARLIHPRFRQRLLPAASPRLLLGKRLLWLTGLLLLLVAAAGPRKGFEFREVKRRGIDILFAIDTSRSMLAEDLTPNRLERARLGIHDFISRLEGDRVGLIPFAGSAYALCPLTSDYDAFRESLNALDTDLIPKQGTDVASAIQEAGQLFDEQGNNHRILVLITDGEDLQGDAINAAREQAKKGMTIYPIGVGSAEGVNIPVLRGNGQRDVLLDASGVPVVTKLDEATLRKIAEAANGFYVPMGRGAEGLDTIYREKLRLVPKNELEGRMERIPLERYEWPLAAALLCLLLEFLLPDHRRPIKTTTLPSAARRPRVTATSATLILLLASSFVGGMSKASAQETDVRILYNKGTSLLTEGNYQSAVDHLKKALNTTDLTLQNRAYYNLGNALYRLGQENQSQEAEATIKAWEEALKAYGDALALDAADADARFNHDLVKRKLEELKKQNPDQKQDKSEQDNKDGEKQDSEDQKDGEKGQEQKQDGQQKKDGGESQEGEEQQDGKSQEESEKKEGESQSSESKDGEKQDGKSSQEGDKKEGEKKEETSSGENSQDSANQQKETAGEEAAKSSTEERKQAQQKQMTAAEAKQLLNMMRGEQRTVIPLERPPQRGRFIDPNNTTKGKTW